jgi:hypothetical protein
MCHFVIEDFPPAMALRRLKMFTKYFAANFKFGRQFDVDLARALSLEDMRERAESFFSRIPLTVAQPTVAGM